MLKRCLGLLLICSCLLLPSKALADSYDVTASVLASLPPTIPVVTGPTNNSVQQNPSVFISGTCTVVVPNLIVVLIRDGKTIGSGNCLTDGTFRILVGLVLGANVIYPKFMTITGQSSGFGLPINVTYTQNTETSPANANTEGADKASFQKLALDFIYDFVVYDTESVTKIAYTIRGGKEPYAVAINWGDETQKNIKVTKSGPQQAEHQYRDILKPSMITIQITDSDGSKVTQSRALVSFVHGLYVPPAAVPKEQKVSAPVVYFVGVGSLTGALLLSHFINLGHPFARTMMNGHGSIKRYGKFKIK